MTGTQAERHASTKAEIRVMLLPAPACPERPEARRKACSQPLEGSNPADTLILDL